MGARGPAPKPTALRILNGEKPYRINTREPQPAEGTPRPPAWLPAAAKPHWRQLVKDLRPMRVLRMADRNALGRLADAYADRQAAQADIDARGILVPGANGVPVRNQACMLKEQADARAHRLELQFGLTPASRTSLVAGVASDSTGAAALLS